MVQFVECVDNNVAHSAVVALRNLAEDLQNKKTIGKYGMQAIVAKVKSHLTPGASQFWDPWGIKRPFKRPFTFLPITDD